MPCDEFATVRSTWELALLLRSDVASSCIGPGCPATSKPHALDYAHEPGSFEGYRYDWWHFTLRDEPYRNTYLDFPVK